MTTFELQPTLIGPRLELRPLAIDDFDALHAAASDPLVWAQHPESDRHRRDVFQRYFDGAIASGGAFAIVDRATGAIVGSSRYCNLDAERREVEIGWTFLARAYWGGAYNSELKSLMLDRAFRFVDRVVFVVGPNNLRSQKALLKVGAQRLDQRRSGPDADHVVFAIDRARRSP